MVDPAITAAIIASATSAAQQGVQMIHDDMKQDGSTVGAVVTNNSQFSFDVFTFDPNHGSWTTSPQPILYGADEVYAEFLKDLKRQGISPDDENKVELFNEFFARKDFNLILEFDGHGDGMGFETPILLKARGLSAPTNIQVALLIRKIPGGDYGVGVGFANIPNFYKNDSDAIIDHIKSVHTDNCKYSDGGGSINVNKGPGLIEIKASAPSALNRIVLLDP